MVTEELIKKAQAGDSEAFTQVYNDTIKTAYYVAKRILVDEEATEDVLQEAYIAVYEHLGDYKSGNFQGWVDTIVANRAKNYLRKKNPVLFSQMETEDNPVVDFEEEKIEFRPEESVDYGETKRLVMEIVDGLSADQRLAIILFYFEQKSIKEIASICECTENTIKSRLNYGRTKIKEEVLALEKKGTKLYCAPILPFLYWMFSQSAAATTVPVSARVATFSAIKTAMAKTAGEVAATAQATSQAAATTTTATTATTAATATTTTTTATTTAASAATTATLSLGAKIAIGAVCGILVLGGGAVAVPAIQAFIEESNAETEDEEDKDTQTEEMDNSEDVVDTETEETLPESYGEIADMVLSQGTQPTDGTYGENPYSVAYALSNARVLESGMALELQNLTDEQKGQMAYSILSWVNSYQAEGFDIPVSDTTIDGVYGVIYDYAVLDAFLAEAYEGGTVKALGNGLQIQDEYVIYMPADGEGWIVNEDVAVLEKDGYVVYQATCREMYNSEELAPEYKYDITLLFKKIEGEQFNLQMVYAETAYVEDHATTTTPETPTGEIKVASVFASTNLAASGGKTYVAENLFDGNLSTAWVEGVEGIGVGETIVIKLESPQQISAIDIYNGYYASRKLYNINGKLTEVVIAFGSGESYTVPVDVLGYGEDSDAAVTDGPFTFTLPEQVVTDSIVITITDAVSGRSYDDTCISELKIR